MLLHHQLRLGGLAHPQPMNTEFITSSSIGNKSSLVFPGCSLHVILAIHPITSRFTTSTLIFPPMLTCIDRSSWAIWLCQALFYPTSPACIELGNDHPAFYTDLVLLYMLYFSTVFFVFTCHFFLSTLNCSLFFIALLFSALAWHESIKPLFNLAKTKSPKMTSSKCWRMPRF